MFWQKKNKRVFLDYASITPVAPEVLKAMEPYYHGDFANPSALYEEALAAKEIAKESRKKIAEILGAHAGEIVFTSGGTEGNNMTLFGIFEAARGKVGKPHIIVSAIEHPSVLEVCEEIKRRGGEVTLVPVGEDGVVRVSDIKDAIQPNTVLVSVMFANNEIGTIQPIREIGKMIQDFKKTRNYNLEPITYPFFHTDACQAALYEDLNVQKLRVDFMTLDGIKMYGPRGAGILYVKSGVEISPIQFGGGQEKGLRSGTENVAAIVGLAKALEIAHDMRKKESERLSEIRDYAIETILKNFPDAKLNGSREYRLPNNINICFSGLDAEFAVVSLDVVGISASYSSSCRTLKEDSSSYVVLALGKPDCATSSLRFTLGRESKKSDIDILVLALQKIIK